MHQIGNESQRPAGAAAGGSAPASDASRPDDLEPDAEEEALEAELEADLGEELSGDSPDPTTSPASVRRARLVLGGRLLVSALLLWLLVTKIDAQWSEALPDPGARTFAWLAGALALTLAGVVVSPSPTARSMRADRPGRTGTSVR